MSKIIKPLSFAVGAALIGSVALSQSSFAMTPLAKGYMLAAATGDAVTKPMDMKMDGKSGEGKCGMAMADTNKDGMVSAAEHAAYAKMKFERMDVNKDGMLSKDEMMEGKMKKMGEGKCGDGKCGGMKDGMKSDGMKDGMKMDAAEKSAPVKK